MLIRSRAHLVDSTSLLRSDASMKLEVGKPVVVLCAGLNRSGSTWQMNVTRELIKSKKPNATIYTSWIDEYNSNSSGEFHLIKAHSFIDAAKLNRDITISTRRYLRAVAGSMIRMRWAAAEWNVIDAFLQKYVKDCSWWEQHADLVLPYEKIVKSPVEAGKDIGRALGLDLSDAAINLALDRVNALRPRGATVTGTVDSADSTTFLHDGHIGDVDDNAATARLAEDVLAKIELKYRHWLVDRGYTPSLERIFTFAENALATDCGTRPMLTHVPSKFAVGAPEGLALFGLDREDWGAWSVKPLCGIAFYVPATAGRADVILRVGALTPEGAPPVCATAFLNGMLAGSWTWHGSVDHQEIRMLLPASGSYVMCFLVHGARSPRSLGIGSDERDIGLAFHEIWIADCA